MHPKPEILLMKLFVYLSSLSRLQVLGVGLLLAALVGSIDYVTDVPISFTVFYLIPIVLVSWYSGRGFGILLSALGAAFHLFSDFHSGIHADIVVYSWNAASRLIIFIGVVWMLNAIRETQRLRLQNEIDQYTRIVETAFEGIIALGKNGRVRYANVRAAQLLGYAEQELSGKPFEELVPDETSRRLIEPGRTGDTVELMKPVETQFLRKHGGSLWTLVSSRTSFGAHNEYEGMVLLVTDISERKLVEEEMRRRYREISAMQHLSTVLARSNDLETRLENALKTALDVTEFDAGAIFMFDEKQNDLTLQHSIGFREGSAAVLQRWPAGVGITGQVCKTGVAQFVPDAEQNDDIDARIRTMEGIRGFASIPLVTKDTVLGVMNLVRRTPHTFSIQDQSMLRAFGNQIGVALDNAKLYEAARSGEQQIRRLSIDLVRIQEDERKRFARELHDGLAQLLMTLRVNAELALKSLGSSGGQVEHHLHEIVALVGEAESEAKQISYDLRPAILDDFGLTAALQVLAKMFFRRTGVAVDLHVPDTDLRFDSVIETTVYRIVQELLANVAKHANASAVTIQLLVRGNLIALTVADNGKGFNVKESLAYHDDEPHSGLRNMRERAESLRGMFRVESTPGRGAEFAIEIPRTLEAIDMEPKGEMFA